MASIIGSSSGVVVGIAYISTIIVIACVVIELLYLQKLALKKKKNKTPKKRQPLIRMAGGVII